jgi:hypothetical protein
MAVVVAGLLTWCVAAEESLPVKLLSPAYVAIKLVLPKLVKAIVQLLAATLPVQVWLPLEIVTLPVGVPLPGSATSMEYETVTGSPIIEGSGVCAVMRVIVVAWPIVCDSAVDVLLLKFPSPL